MIIKFDALAELGWVAQKYKWLILSQLNILAEKTGLWELIQPAIDATWRMLELENTSEPIEPEKGHLIGIIEDVLEDLLSYGDLPDRGLLYSDNPDDFVSVLENVVVIDFDTFSNGDPVPTGFNDDGSVAEPPFSGTEWADMGAIFISPNGQELRTASTIDGLVLFESEPNSFGPGAPPFVGLNGVEDDNDDDLVIEVVPPREAVGLFLIDNGNSNQGEALIFRDENDQVIIKAAPLPVRGPGNNQFVGVLSPGRPIATVELVEAFGDGDDVNIDDVILGDIDPLVIIDNGDGGNGDGPGPDVILPPDEVFEVFVKLRLLQEVEKIQKKVKLVAHSELSHLLDIAWSSDTRPENRERLLIVLMDREGMLGDPRDDIFPERQLKLKAMDILREALRQTEEGWVRAEIKQLILKFDALLEIQEAEWELKRPTLNAIEALAHSIEVEIGDEELAQAAWEAVGLMKWLIDMERFGVDVEQGPYPLHLKEQLLEILHSLGEPLSGGERLDAQRNETIRLVQSLWEMEHVAVKFKYLILTELFLLQQDLAEAGVESDLPDILGEVQGLTREIWRMEGSPPRPEPTREDVPTDGGEPDQFDSSLTMIIDLAGIDQDEVVLTGSVQIQRQGTTTDPTSGNTVIETEIVSMDLTGTSAVLGQISMTLNPNLPNVGKLVSQQTGQDFTADSFFDVFTEVNFLDQGILATSTSPLELNGPISEYPPTSLQLVSQALINLVDSNENVVAAVHDGAVLNLSLIQNGHGEAEPPPALPVEQRIKRETISILDEISELVRTELGTGPSDDFDADALSPVLWRVAINPEDAGMAEVVDGRLVHTMNPGEPRLNIDTFNRCLIQGDFDAKVKYDLLTWPADNEIRVGLVARRGGPDYAVERVSDDDFGGESYLVDFEGSVAGTTSTEDLSGGLRLTRVDGTFTGYYLNNDGEWVMIHSSEGADGPVQLRLATWTEDETPGGVAAFDDFAVEADETECNFPQRLEIRDLTLKIDAMLELEITELWLKEAMLFELHRLAEVAQAWGWSEEQLDHIRGIIGNVEWLWEIETFTGEDGRETPGTFSPTGGMATARATHTATLLPDGNVLVAGGCCPFTNSAELYDPSAGTFSATGSMETARGSHTATLLPDGNVLVAGGLADEVHFASAELYNPSNGTWSPTASMATTRREHTATLLTDGTVLVAGGFNGDAISSAERYDPSSGNWTPTGGMMAARYGHKAELLPDGKVLVAGGFGGGYLTSAELFDPSTGTWSPTGSMATARYGHTAISLPDGKVLVAGGFNGSFTDSAEVYDPGAGTWTPTGNLTVPRVRAKAALLPDGKVLITGGENSSGVLASAEVYNLDTSLFFGTYEEKKGVYSQHTATLLPVGTVLLAGGFDSTNYLTSAELYYPSSREEPPSREHPPELEIKGWILRDLSEMRRWEIDEFALPWIEDLISKTRVVVEIEKIEGKVKWLARHEIGRLLDWAEQHDVSLEVIDLLAQVQDNIRELMILEGLIPRPTPEEELKGELGDVLGRLNRALHGDEGPNPIVELLALKLDALVDVEETEMRLKHLIAGEIEMLIGAAHGWGESESVTLPLETALEAIWELIRLEREKGGEGDPFDEERMKKDIIAWIQESWELSFNVPGLLFEDVIKKLDALLELERIEVKLKHLLRSELDMLKDHPDVSTETMGTVEDGSALVDRLLALDGDPGRPEVVLPLVRSEDEVAVFVSGTLTVESEGSTEQVLVEGHLIVTTVGGDDATDPDGDGRAQFETEILSMDLSGNSDLLGGVVVIREDPQRLSVGRIAQQSAEQRDIFPADSFFDIFVEVSTPGGDATSDQPVRLVGILTHEDRGMFSTESGFELPSPGSTTLTLPSLSLTVEDIQELNPEELLKIKAIELLQTLLEGQDGGQQSQGLDFVPAVNYPVEQTTQTAHSITAADLNGDGHLDLAAVNYDSSNGSVLLNNGDGTFAAAVLYPVGAQPQSVVAGDLDGDGDLDLATANFNSDNASVLLNNGNGTFATAVNYGAGVEPQTVAAGDLDSDGDLDLVVANQLSDDVSVLLNNGNGTFAMASNYPAGDSPKSVAVGDLDGNGDPDLVTANALSDNASVLLNNGNGTFATAVNYGAGDFAVSVAVVDLDGDTVPDLAVANAIAGNVSVLINDGTGVFAAAANYPAGATPNSVTAGDLDCDGHPDLALANDVSDEVSLLLNNGNGTFAAPTAFAVGDGPLYAAVGDLDGDGYLDVAVINKISTDASVLINRTSSCRPPVTVTEIDDLILKFDTLLELEAVEADLKDAILLETEYFAEYGGFPGVWEALEVLGSLLFRDELGLPPVLGPTDEELKGHLLGILDRALEQGRQRNEGPRDWEAEIFGRVEEGPWVDLRRVKLLREKVDLLVEVERIEVKLKVLILKEAKLLNEATDEEAVDQVIDIVWMLMALEGVQVDEPEPVFKERAIAWLNRAANAANDTNVTRFSRYAQTAPLDIILKVDAALEMEQIKLKLKLGTLLELDQARRWARADGESDELLQTLGDLRDVVIQMVALERGFRPLDERGAEIDLRQRALDLISLAEDAADGDRVQLAVAELNLKLVTLDELAVMDLSMKLVARAQLLTLLKWAEEHGAGEGYIAALERALENVLRVIAMETVPALTTLDLEPETATNAVGDSHTVTATVTDQFGIPVEGVTVNFDVTIPELEETADTDSNGQATFTYSSDVAGAHTIRAWVEAGSFSNADPDLRDTATKDWVTRQAAHLTLEPESAQNDVGTTHTVTATVTDQSGDPLMGVDVSFSVAAGPNVGISGSATTDILGQAAFTYTDANGPGTDTIRAWTSAATFAEAVDDLKDKVTKEWVARQASQLDLEPVNAQNDVGTTHRVTATVTDQFGDPLEGVNVSFSVAAGPNAPSTGSATTVATDSSGEAFFEYPGNSAGTDIIQAWVGDSTTSFDGTPANLRAEATKDWVTEGP